MSKEALEGLKVLYDVTKISYEESAPELLPLAERFYNKIKQALQRNIPMKPCSVPNVFVPSVMNKVCGECKTVFENKRKYCSECGQAIDWSK